MASLCGHQPAAEKHNSAYKLLELHREISGVIFRQKMIVLFLAILSIGYEDETCIHQQDDACHHP
jgi:hypothetical protein